LFSKIVLVNYHFKKHKLRGVGGRYF